MPQTQIDEAAERVKFEADYVARCGLRMEDYDLSYDSNANRYEDDYEQSAWEAWLAAKRAVLSEEKPIRCNSNQLKIPVDWQLVPKVLTDDMLVAFAEQWYSKRRCIDDCEMEDCYAAMLEAAPIPPVAGQLFANTEQLESTWLHAGLIERLRIHANDKDNTAFARSTMREVLEYVVAPPAAEAKNSEDTARMDFIDSNASGTIRMDDEDMPRYVHWGLSNEITAREAIDAARATLAAKRDT